MVTELEGAVSAPDYTSTPERVRLIGNPGTLEAEPLTVFLNPTDLSETIQVEWSRLPVIGLDHEVIHYSRTKSIEFPLAFYFSAYEAAQRLEEFETASASAVNGNFISQAEQQRSADFLAVKSASMNFVNFFRSLCFPTRKGFRPPSVQVRWPNVYDILGVVSTLRFAYHKFDRTLTPIVYGVEITILETRISRRFSEEVRQFGLLHTQPAEGGR